MKPAVHCTFKVQAFCNKKKFFCRSEKRRVWKDTNKFYVESLNKYSTSMSYFNATISLIIVTDYFLDVVGGATCGSATTVMWWAGLPVDQ